MTSSNSKLISIIVPVFNESPNIRPFHQAIVKVFEAVPYRYELLFVDDGSYDNTYALIGEMAGSHPEVKALSLSRNFGSHNAITAGLRHCQGDAAVIMAVDMQDPPQTVLEFLKKWEEGFEVVWGIRKSRQDSRRKKIGSTLFYRLLRLIAIRDYPVQGTGSFCLLARKVYEALNTFPERNRVIFGLVAWTGFRQTNVYYDRASRLEGSSKWNFLRIFKTGIDVFTAYSYIPLRIMSCMGIFSLLLSAAVIFYAFMNWCLKKHVEPGWTTLIISIFGLGGVQMLFLGIIGEYLWRISEDVKCRPIFIIRDQIGIKHKA